VGLNDSPVALDVVVHVGLLGPQVESQFGRFGTERDLERVRQAVGDVGRQDHRAQPAFGAQQRRCGRDTGLADAAFAGVQDDACHRDPWAMVVGGRAMLLRRPRPADPMGCGSATRTHPNKCSILGVVSIEYREEPCKVALNLVKGMPFRWSLNPYVGCAHRCTFCYVRAFEARADRPSDDRYGRSIRVKVNVADVLRRELARRSWQREPVAIGAATDPYQPAEGRYRLTRACIEAFSDVASPFSIITRGPLVVRDVDVLAEAACRAEVSVTFSVPTLDHEIWRRTEPGTAPPRQRLHALARLVEA